jgi:hypothetical protein
MPDWQWPSQTWQWALWWHHHGDDPLLPNMNPIIECELGRVSVWNRSRRSIRDVGWWRRWYLVIGASPSARSNGGRRRRKTRASYSPKRTCNRDPTESKAHLEPSVVVHGDDWWQKRAHGRDIWRWPAKGNDKNKRLSSPRPNSFSLEDSIVDAELQRYSDSLEVACSDGANEHQI